MATFTAFGDVYNRLGLLETEVENLSPGTGLPAGVYEGTNPFDINVVVGTADYSAQFTRAKGDRIGFLPAVLTDGSTAKTETFDTNDIRNGQILRLVNLGVSTDDKYVFTFSGSAFTASQIIEILPGEAYSLVYVSSLAKFLVIPGFINGGYNNAPS